MSTAILYRLARPGGEYNALYAMMKRRMGEKQSLGWPTVVAEEAGKPAAFLSTIPHEKLVVAGPLVIDSDARRPWVFLRLVEAYENVLRAAGVTEYVFTVNDVTHPDYAAQISKLCGAPLGRDGDYLTFQRSVA